MSFVPKPRFPDVPKLPGVPQLVRASTAVQSAILPVVNLGGGLAQLALSITAKPVWGIYKYTVPTPASAVAAVPAIDSNGDEILPEVTVTGVRPVLQPDSIFRLGYTQEYTLPTNPIQDGSFETYNKIATPYEIELRLIKSGSLADRARFLDDLESVGASLDLFRIVTPERTYQPVNVSGFSIVREGAQGAYYFTEVDIRVVEIRQVKAQYSSVSTGGDASTANAQDPSSLPTTNLGTLNAVTPDASVQGKVSTALAPFRAASHLFTG
jgi:hypothetical protein